MFDAEHIYALDLETDTTLDGLNPAVAAVTELALSTADGDHIFAGDEAHLLGAGLDRLAELEAGLVVTWNGSFFDLPFLAERVSLLRGPGAGRALLRLVDQPGLTPKYPLTMPAYRYAQTGSFPAAGGSRHQHLDIMFGYRQLAAELGVNWSLKPVAQALGLAMVVVDRENMHLLTAAQRATYASSDTRGTRALALRLLGA